MNNTTRTNTAFSCQLAIGTVFPDGENGMGFKADKGIFCGQAGSPQDMFQLLSSVYNTPESIRDLIDSGDCIKSGDRLVSTGAQEGFSITDDSEDYKKVAGHVPVMFLYVEELEDWIFFSFRRHHGTEDAVLRPYAVSMMVNNTYDKKVNGLPVSNEKKCLVDMAF